MCNSKLWVKIIYGRGVTDTQTDTQVDKHINTMTRSGLRAGPSENMNQTFFCQGVIMVSIV